MGYRLVRRAVLPSGQPAVLIPGANPRASAVEASLSSAFLTPIATFARCVRVVRPPTIRRIRFIVFSVPEEVNPLLVRSVASPPAALWTPCPWGVAGFLLRQRQAHRREGAAAAVAAVAHQTLTILRVVPCRGDSRARRSHRKWWDTTAKSSPSKRPARQGRGQVQDPSRGLERLHWPRPGKVGKAGQDGRPNARQVGAGQVDDRYWASFNPGGVGDLGFPITTRAGIMQIFPVEPPPRRGLTAPRERTKGERTSYYPSGTRNATFRPPRSCLPTNIQGGGPGGLQEE